MSTLASVIEYDLFSNRPAAGIAGRLFFASDTKNQYRDNGSTWDDITPGEVVLLESHTASNSASLDFTAWYSSDYDEYVVELVELLASAGTPSLIIQLAGDSTSGHYNWSWVYNGTPSAGSPGTYDQGAASYTSGIVINNNGDTAQPIHGTLKLFNPAGTTTHKFVMIDSISNSSRIVVNHGAGEWASNAAYTTFSILMSSGNIASGTIRIYGIKNT